MAQLSTLPPDELHTALTALSLSPKSSSQLAQRAIHHLLDALRIKTREMAWTVIRNAYRELSCQPDSQLDTRSWLMHSLSLQSDPDLNQWLELESGLGHVRKKEGIEGRWIVCKPR
jgi:hypothetical protein